MLRSRRYMRRDYRGADSMLRAPDLPTPTSQADKLRLSWERLGVSTALGQLAEADGIAEDLAVTMAANGAQGTASYLRSMPAQFRTFFLGDAKALAQYADSALPPAALDALPADQRSYFGLGYAYSLAGRADRVRELKAEWTRVVPAEEQNAADSVYWSALLAQAEQRWREAAMTFDAHRVMVKCPNCDLWDAARSWELAGQTDSALARYETLVTIPETRSSGGDAAFELAPTYRRLGSLYEAKGDRARALEYYGNFVDLWRDADPVLQPQVAEVKARMAELAGEK
jgi:tetratricopeptide (TPR) repeat protein